MIRFEFAADENLLYVGFGEGPAVETIEVEESVYIDLDSSERPIGIEFLNAGDFLAFLQRRGGQLLLPEHITDRSLLAPAS
jgi:uncharacterized protein YuzE